MVEKMTKKEVFTKLYNEYLERVCRWEVDIEYFTSRANHFKKKTPDHKQALDTVKEKEAGLFWDKLLLKVTDILIKAYANSDKKTTTGSENKT